MKSLSLPFKLDGYGRVRSTSSPEKIYADRVRFALLTVPGERIMNPAFGSPIPEQLFTTPDDIDDDIEAGVRQAFSEFLPDLVLDDIEVTAEDLETGTVQIEVTYTASSNLETYSSTVTLPM